MSDWLWPDPTWTCIECKREFKCWFNHGEEPHAVKTACIDGVTREIGEMCRACYEGLAVPAQLAKGDGA